MTDKHICRYFFKCRAYSNPVSSPISFLSEAQAAPVPPAARKKLKVAEVSTEQKNTLVTKDQPNKAREESLTGNSKNKNVNTPTNLLTPQAHATQPSTVPTTREEFAVALNNQEADNGMLQTKKEQVTGFNE